MPGDYSNELSAYAAGTSLTSQAEGFTPGVLGAYIDQEDELSPTTELSASPTPTGRVLAKNSDEKGSRDYLWLLLFIPVYFGLRRVFKKN